MLLCSANTTLITPTTINPHNQLSLSGQEVLLSVKIARSHPVLDVFLRRRDEDPHRDQEGYHDSDFVTGQKIACSSTHGSV